MKAAVAFEAKQLAIEEPLLTSIGISPGFCDTKMVAGLFDGTCKLLSHLQSPYLNSCVLLIISVVDEGWTKDDALAYHRDFGKFPMVSPKIVGRAYAYAVTRAPHECTGLDLEYSASELGVPPLVEK